MVRGARRTIARALLTFAVLAGAAAALGTLSACNTAAGFGKDMSAAGQAVAGTADRVKNSSQ